MHSSNFVLECDWLRVEFARPGDRFGHVISARDANGEWVAVLESIEGTPAEHWPASPALQEVHFEDRPGGQRLALAVGMAGKSHWSLSVACDPAAGRLLFDVACRVRMLPEQVGSTYRGLSDVPVAAQSDGALRIGKVRIVTDGQTARGEARPDGTIAIRATEPTTGRWPQTIRWQYAIEGLRQAQAS